MCAPTSRFPVAVTRAERSVCIVSLPCLPLEGDLEIFGAVSAELYTLSSREFTDFFARLCDVDGSGKSINVCDGYCGCGQVIPPSRRMACVACVLTCGRPPTVFVVDTVFDYR